MDTEGWSIQPRGRGRETPLHSYWFQSSERERARSTNPIPRLSGALHVYGGAFFDVPRSEWDPETLHEGRYDAERARRLFAQS